MSANYERAASFMRDLSDTVAREVKRRFDLPQDRAVEIGMDVAQKACDEYGGEFIYVPIGLAIQISARDLELVAFYNANARDIVATAKRFEMTVPNAYKRIRMIEVAEFNERQGGLFQEGDE